MSLGTGGVADGGSNGGNASGSNVGASGGTGSQGDNGGGQGNQSSGSSGSGPGNSAGAGSSDGGKSTASGSGAGSGDKGSQGNLGTGTQQSGASWRDSLPDDLKADPVLSKYSDVANLAKAHLEAQKLIGKKGLFKPGKDASAEEIKAFREAMGIPTEVDKYDLGKFEGVEVDPAIVDWAKKMGTENGLEPAAMNKMITEYMKLEATQEQFIEKAVKDDMTAAMGGLRKEWGEAFDQNLKRANIAAEKSPNSAEFIAELKEYGADNSPAILKYLNWVASLLGESTLREGGVAGGRQTPQELEADIQRTQSELFNAKPGTGAHAALKSRYESLWKQKTGGR